MMFGRNKESKEVERTFYAISEIKKEGFISENLLRYDIYPMFEDKKEANEFCNQLKRHRINAAPYGMKYTKNLLDQLREKNIPLIGKKDDEIDYRCYSCNALFSHKQVKWKHRTYKTSELLDADFKLQATLNEIQKITGRKDEQTADPNRIFNGIEYENRGNCPKCNVELTCFWFGINSVKKNPKSIEHNMSFGCPECDNVMRKEFQVWYSFRIAKPDVGSKEYLVTVCPKCKTEIAYNGKCDFELGIIE